MNLEKKTRKTKKICDAVFLFYACVWVPLAAQQASGKLDILESIVDLQRRENDEVHCCTVLYCTVQSYCTLLYCTVSSTVLLL